jgi:hypothetical protein
VTNIRIPHGRAHMLGGRSILSCARSSWTSAGSMTASLRPDGTSAASLTSDPNRAGRSRRSTTMPPPSAERNAPGRPWRWPFRALPTSATTSATRMPPSRLAGRRLCPALVAFAAWVDRSFLLGRHVGFVPRLRGEGAPRAAAGRSRRPARRTRASDLQRPACHRLRAGADPRARRSRPARRQAAAVRRQVRLPQSPAPADSGRAPATAPPPRGSPR